MLVTFHCDAHENITMFGDVALRLIKMMGHSGTIPSAILAEEVPDALSHLQEALKSAPQEAQAKYAPEDKDEGEPDVTLAQRAFPLMALLQSAATHKCDVMWK